MTFYARAPSALGQILLCVNDDHLTGLYFVGQKDCPVIDGLPPHRPEARDPTFGTLSGRPIRNFRAGRSDSRALFGDGANGDAAWAQIAGPRAMPPTGGLTLMQPQTTPSALAVFERTRHELDEYFTGLRTVFSVPLAMSGTPFQKKVWEALRSIPYGEVASYADVARRAGYAAGYGRPVGAAVGRNPLTIIVPCHRVLSSTGTLNGYTGGLERKFALLNLEGWTIAPG